MNKTKCDFCNKTIKKDHYTVKDKYKVYKICSECNTKTKVYEREYNILARRIENNYKKQLEEMSLKLRKKYKLIAGK